MRNTCADPAGSGDHKLWSYPRCRPRLLQVPQHRPFRSSACRWGIFWKAFGVRWFDGGMATWRFWSGAQKPAFRLARGSDIGDSVWRRFGPHGSRSAMMPGPAQWLIRELLLFLLTAICTHMVISGSQTLLHRWVGHRRLGGILHRNHIRFHHAYYARGHLASATYRGAEGNNTPFFLIPTVLVGGGLFLVLPLELFLVMALVSATSFYAHVFLDREYHVENSKLERFAWFRRKQQLHFVHHLHANSNFAVIEFSWDRLIGTYRSSDTDRRSCR